MRTRASFFEAFYKLLPWRLWANPIMGILEIICILSTVAWWQAGWTAFGGRLCAWLWLTLYLASLSEAWAERRIRRQYLAQQGTKRDLVAKRVRDLKHLHQYERVPASALQVGDWVLVEAGDRVPSDGVIIAGIALVDESAINGMSAPVIREKGPNTQQINAGSIVLTDWLLLRITAVLGQTFLDRLLAMNPVTKRRKTPNETALSSLLLFMTLSTLGVMASLAWISHRVGGGFEPLVLLALSVCLMPTTIGGLLPAIGLAGITRLAKAKVLALSNQAVEAAGDVDIILVDKTGTLTLGNRQAVGLLATEEGLLSRLEEAVYLTCLRDGTPEGRSALALVQASQAWFPAAEGLQPQARFVAFSAQTRMSGMDLGNRHFRKGAPDAISAYVVGLGGQVPVNLQERVEWLARQGETPLLVCEDAEVLGLIRFKDVVKSGMQACFQALRAAHIQTVLVTGDNSLTANAIAREAGIEQIKAAYSPEEKSAYLAALQESGKIVAMLGDGTNDVPALARADVAFVMNTGSQAAKEAGNLIDLDSNPAKLWEVIRIGKQILMMRGALTTFSFANDAAKYFAILPVVYQLQDPLFAKCNLMGLTEPRTAILAAVIFNSLIIGVMTPWAFRGVHYGATSPNALLARHLLVWGLGGLLAPFVGISLIYQALIWLAS